MGDRVVEPSEILTGRQETKQRGSFPIPVLRLIARFFDYALFFTLLYMILRHLVHPPRFEQWIPLEFLAWVPIETLLLWTWGTTPGKALLGIQIKKKNSQRISIDCALKRSALVWFRGVGMGIPLVNFLCMGVAYYRLRTLHLTSWDRDQNTVVMHRSIAPWRLYVGLGVAFAGWCFYIYWKNIYV